MTTFTSTELRTESVKVYNTVQAKQPVVIKHRDRPEMVLVDKETLEKALVDDSARAVLIADLTF